jgi:hypothetical protein
MVICHSPVNLPEDIYIHGTQLFAHLGLLHIWRHPSKRSRLGPKRRAHLEMPSGDVTIGIYKHRKWDLSMQNYGFYMCLPLCLPFF